MSIYDYKILVEKRAEEKDERERGVSMKIEKFIAVLCLLAAQQLRVKRQKVSVKVKLIKTLVPRYFGETRHALVQGVI